MSRRGRPPKVASGDRFSLILAWAVIVAAAAFASYHVVVVFSPRYLPVERVLAVGLLGSALYFGTNGIGYAIWVIRSRKHEAAENRYFTRRSLSSVACLIPIRDEPAEVIEETLASVCALRYERKTVYLLDDSVKAESRRAADSLARTFGAVLIRRPTREHFKAGNLNHALARVTADYIAVFDADQRPEATFLSDLVLLLDDNPRLALIQTPQAYTNTTSLIAAAASLQNGLFYEYVAEAKDVVGAMFCCGTNCLIRRHALEEVGGFDATSLTEDFATTLKLHAAGWQTKFYGSLYVKGLGPETLGSYLKQYSRWATGTFQVLLAAVKTFVKDRRALTGQQWFEYWLSCSYYLSGPVNFYLLLLPPANLLLGLNPIRANPFAYLSLFAAVLLCFWSLFLFTARRRGYPPKRLIIACARLETCKFYVYTKALINVLLGRTATFKVTEKGSSHQLAWKSLWAPLTVLAVNVVSVMVGLARIGEALRWYLAVNTILAAYNVWMLSAVIQYNTGSDQRPLAVFEPHSFRSGPVQPLDVEAGA